MRQNRASASKPQLLAHLLLKHATETIPLSQRCASGAEYCPICHVLNANGGRNHRCQRRISTSLHHSPPLTASTIPPSPACSRSCEAVHLVHSHPSLQCLFILVQAPPPTAAPDMAPGAAKAALPHTLCPRPLHKLHADLHFMLPPGLILFPSPTLARGSPLAPVSNGVPLSQTALTPSSPPQQGDMLRKKAAMDKLLDLP
jgi:hypothetical protein